MASHTWHEVCSVLTGYHTCIIILPLGHGTIYLFPRWGCGIQYGIWCTLLVHSLVCILLLLAIPYNASYGFNILYVLSLVLVVLAVMVARILSDALYFKFITRRCVSSITERVNFCQGLIHILKFFLKKVFLLLPNSILQESCSCFYQHDLVSCL